MRLTATHFLAFVTALTFCAPVFAQEEENLCSSQEEVQARTEAESRANSHGIFATVKHLTRVKILESNNVSLRPGSIYDNSTYFESILEPKRPGFNYEFLDSGLGAAEPLYPMYQKGHQGSYAQIMAAFFSEKNRHIDHFSSLMTPENCLVDSMYLLRDIDEYPRTEFVQERKEGNTLIVIRLEYYTRMSPDAQCGRHRANDPDPNFDPMKFMKDHKKAMHMEDFPQAELARFEAKLSASFHIKQKMFPKWPKFDLNNLSKNSLWYYPNGHTFDYGIDHQTTQPGLSWFSRPRHLVIPATSSTQNSFGLDDLLKPEEFQSVMSFLNGKPVDGFNPASEPGHDTLRLSDVTSRNLYTSGLDMEHIQDVVGDVSDPKHYKLVATIIKPYELQDDIAWEGTKAVPQIRFVYQLMDPRHPDRPFEQLFLHLKWDTIDRLAKGAERDKQYKYFLSRVDQLTQARETNAPNLEDVTKEFIAEFTLARPIRTIAFGSALSGIWVFGALSRDHNVARELKAVKIIRGGVDLGYYSSTYDNDVFRAVAKTADAAKKAELEKILDDITVSTFRDPKRQDVEAISFNRVSCAQCHQMSGRDGVHMSFNDGLDRRFTAPISVSEYFFHDADDQLKKGKKFWGNSPH